MKIGDVVDDILRIADRRNNSKRSYVLVNPLQGKHLPVSPTVSYDMTKALGEKLRVRYSGNGKKKVLFIGFAETATAIGAVVAECFGEDSFYIHTTRENLRGDLPFYDFLEEHSHATEQRLYAPRFEKAVKNAELIVLVEDEISTGKTIRNIVAELKKKLPEIHKIPFVAASILNRMGEEELSAFGDAGIVAESLFSIAKEEYPKQVQEGEEVDLILCEGKQDSSGVNRLYDYKPRMTPSNRCIIMGDIPNVYLRKIIGKVDPRKGTSIDIYRHACKTLGKEIISLYEARKIQGEKLLILGTEECMYPAMICGKMLEQKEKNLQVRWHATTRSPIVASRKEDYPIQEAYEIRSFYEKDRVNYIYNLEYYDSVVVISDATEDLKEAQSSLIQALSTHGYGEIFIIRWEY